LGSIEVAQAGACGGKNLAFENAWNSQSF